jgi:hypothetical protein
MMCSLLLPAFTAARMFTESLLSNDDIPLLLHVWTCLQSCCLAMVWSNPLQYLDTQYNSVKNLTIPITPSSHDMFRPQTAIFRCLSYAKLFHCPLTHFLVRRRSGRSICILDGFILCIKSNSLSDRYGIEYSWPPYSFDFNPCYYLLRNFLKDHVYSIRPQFITNLKTKIRSHQKYRYRGSGAESEITQLKLGTVGTFWNKAEIRGGHIENLYNF